MRGWNNFFRLLSLVAEFGLLVAARLPHLHALSILFMRS
jgi:hypothetical protein